LIFHIANQSGGAAQHRTPSVRRGVSLPHIDIEPAGRNLELENGNTFFHSLKIRTGKSAKFVG